MIVSPGRPAKNILYTTYKNLQSIMDEDQQDIVRVFLCLFPRFVSLKRKSGLRGATFRCPPWDLLDTIIEGSSRNMEVSYFPQCASWSWDRLPSTAVDKLFLNSCLCNTSIVRNVGLSPHSMWIFPLITRQEHHRAFASYKLWHTDKSDDLENTSKVFLCFVLKLNREQEIFLF